MDAKEIHENKDLLVMPRSKPNIVYLQILK